MPRAVASRWYLPPRMALKDRLQVQKFCGKRGEKTEKQ